MTIAELIRRKVEELPEGRPFTAAAFLSIAERTTVDKTLARMVKSELLTRPTRGVFVRPKQSRFGAVPPEILEVAAAKLHGEAIEIHGAEALRRFGLSTQTPVRPVFNTTGRTRTFYVGKMPVRLQHVSQRKLVHPGTKVGMAVTALWYLGKDQLSKEVFEAIESRLSPEEFATLKSAATQMPGWMSNALYRYRKEKQNA